MFAQKAGKLILAALKFILRKAADGARLAAHFIKEFVHKNAKGAVKELASIASKRARSLVAREKQAVRQISANDRALKGVAIAMTVVILFSFITGFAVNISGVRKSENQFNKDAGAVCTKIISKHGAGKTEHLYDESGKERNLYRITGLAFARRMDFNGDKKAELLVCYEDGGIYYVEVWGYIHGEFVKLYSDVANVNEASESIVLPSSFISIRHIGGKCAIAKIGEADGGNMKMYSFNGKRFKESGVCTYDAENEAYMIGKEDCSDEFETIQLNYLLPFRAQKTVEATSNYLNQFETLSINEIEEAKTEEEKQADAYYEIVEKYNQKYGRASVKSHNGLNYADGLCVVRLLDFNADGSKELMLVYRYNKKVASEDKKGDMVLVEEPAYYMEVYSWNGKAAKLIYENDGLTTFKDNKDEAVFYILQQDGKKINICRNSYQHEDGKSRVWKATSRIVSLNDDGAFEPVFIAAVNCNYDYMTYYLSDEKVSKKKFAETGYTVPYFCNDDSFDSSKFAVVTLQSTQKIENVTSDTVSAIKVLNDNYHE